MTRNQKTIISILLLATIAQFGLQTYTPVLPILQNYFSVSAESIQLSITLYLLPFGLSTLIYGPFSDYFGRKPIIIFGIAIHLLGAIVAAFSTNIAFFFLGRIFQGLGAGATATIARAIIRDYFEDTMVNMVSVLVMVMSIAPAIAPTLGGFLYSVWGWRAIFYFLILYNTVAFSYILFFYEETNSNRKKQRLSIKKCLKDYFSLFINLPFQKNIFAIFLSYSCQVAFWSIAPFVFQKLLFLTPQQYGLLALLPAVGYFFGGLAIRKLNAYFSTKGIVFVSACLLALIGIIWLVLYQIGCFSVFLTIWPVILGFVLIAIIFTCATVDFLKPYGHMAGTATAFAALAQMFGSSFITYAIQEIFPDTPTPIAFSFIFCGCFIAILFSRFTVKEAGSR